MLISGADQVIQFLGDGSSFPLEGCGLTLTHPLVFNPQSFSPQSALSLLLLPLPLAQWLAGGLDS
ncbi:hypothetical protein E2C01_089483 [Portunus trituberculatus]|uniref:Uncharacterized protein n=1 Tax=Portunus trituberculatus TaxID=210409 RepID=A0A5B7JHC1_PORTR|nr:hypothetical protein [Portunus trituberculatus]